MRPVTFNGCFGWLHTEQQGVGSDVAVVMCSGLNRDSLDSHHSFRLLAEEFAAAGYPAMRFDYPGTGDSCDVPDAETWAVWQQSVHHAADLLRHATGAHYIVFFGLRVGAMLATLVAESRDDVPALILLEPVLRGHSYIRQLSVQAELLSGTRLKPGEALDFHELHFSARTVELIAKADLRQAKLDARHHVMLLSQSSSTLLVSCERIWSQRGARVVAPGMQGLEPMLHPNLRTEDIPADFSHIITWLRGTIPTRPIPLAAVPMLGAARLHPPGCIETPLRFGPRERLFGILCRPSGLGPAGMAVIIGNTGRDPHHGSARFAVEFARRLASEGIASLRIDFAGLGDSIGSAGNEKVLSPLFETDRSLDIRDAIDVLEQLGYERFTLHGLCAGAYHAFHAALADQRIAALLLINMPVFLWRAGDSIDFVRRKTSTPAHFLFKIASLESWSRLLQSRLDVSGAVRAQYERLHDSIRQTGLRMAERIARTGPRSFARRALASLSQRGARTLFLFAPGDGGIDAFERELGRDGGGLRAYQGTTMLIVPGMDHMLSDATQRQTAANLMIDFLRALPTEALSGMPALMETAD